MAWPWSKKSIDMTSDAFSRWLRAMRPPFDWFHRQSELVQEQLAKIGDDHFDALGIDLAQGIALALQDPEIVAATAKSDAGDSAGDEAIAKRMAANLLGKFLGHSQTPPEEPQRPGEPWFESPAETMAGIGERRIQRANERQEERDRMGTRLLRRAPDMTGQGKTPDTTTTEDQEPTPLEEIQRPSMIPELIRKAQAQANTEAAG